MKKRAPEYKRRQEAVKQYIKAKAIRIKAEKEAEAKRLEAERLAEIKRKEEERLRKIAERKAWEASPEGIL